MATVPRTIYDMLGQIRQAGGLVDSVDMRQLNGTCLRALAMFANVQGRSKLKKGGTRCRHQAMVGNFVAYRHHSFESTN